MGVGVYGGGVRSVFVGVMTRASDGELFEVTAWHMSHVKCQMSNANCEVQTS